MNTKVRQSIVYFKAKLYLCRTLNEAIHNKDYSVVKTFEAGRKARFLFYYPSTLSQKKVYATK